jgi:8-oxo-dGTP pyrophosphatase MutT (NUDIX family)
MRKAVRAVVVKDDALLVMHRNKFGEEYYTLIGGGISVGETPEHALMREVHEETSLSVANPRLVYVEQAGDPYGDQFIFLCDYSSGEVALSTESTEAKIHALGANLYEPVWLPIKKLAEVSFVSEALKNTLVKALTQGFPSQPQTI